MPGLAENLLTIARLRQDKSAALANLAEPLRLKIVAPSGSNPGELRMVTYIPAGLPTGAPLVVVLHGCTQNAAAYDHGAGWSTLAERHGFALLFPEQQRANNPNLCFNWFQPGDVTRGQGEVASIRAMVEQVLAAHALDRRRVFITGLSAGAAMTTAMLATSPDLFAGGAIIAGLPYGAAASMSEAFSAMGQARRLPARQWGNLVRAASSHHGPWPAVQIWQGTADTTVNPANADQLVLQWTDVLGLPPVAPLQDVVDGARHEAWPGLDGRPALERWTVPGLAHGTPIATGGTDADRSVGAPGPHMLAAPINSTWHLAQSWGLLTQASRPRAANEPAPQAGSLIERTLRSAGLMQ